MNPNHATATQNTPPVAAPPQVPLTFCTQPGCGEAAEFQFLWPWGDRGACCALHRTHIQQKSDQLERGAIAFTALDPGRTPPLSRDERTQLIAARMSAELDANEAKVRGGELYAENTRLADEVRRMLARNKELEAQVRDRVADVKQAQKERDEASANAHEAAAELARVKPLVGKPNPFGPPPADAPPMVTPTK